jgi:hypothetical protein
MEWLNKGATLKTAQLCIATDAYPTQTVQETKDSLEMVSIIWIRGQSGFGIASAGRTAPLGYIREIWRYEKKPNYRDFANNDIDYLTPGIHHDSLVFLQEIFVLVLRNGICFTMNCRTGLNLRLLKNFWDYIFNALLGVWWALQNRRHKCLLARRPSLGGVFTKPKSETAEDELDFP